MPKSAAAKHDKQVVRTDKNLLSAVDDLDLLIAHAIRAKVAIEKKRLEVLLDAKRAIHEGSLSPEQEVNFWAEFLELGKQFHPVTVDSLRASTSLRGSTSENQNAVRRFLSFLGTGPIHQSEAERRIRYYKVISIIFLAILVFAQSYVIWGSSTVRDIKKLVGERNEAIANITALNNKISFDNNTNYLETVESIRSKDKYINEITPIILARRYVLLEWRYLFCVYNIICERKEIYTTDKRDSEKGRAITSFSANWQLEKEVHMSTLYLEILSKYLLPFLYGLVGATVYILRSLTKQIQELTYTSASGVQYGARVILGGLAGLAIGWVVTDTLTPGAFQSLAPVTLAFLAGYSVELLFSAMDTIISAFTRTQSNLKDSPRQISN